MLFFFKFFTWLFISTKKSYNNNKRKIIFFAWTKIPNWLILNLWGRWGGNGCFCVNEEIRSRSAFCFIFPLPSPSRLFRLNNIACSCFYFFFHDYWMAKIYKKKIKVILFLFCYKLNHIFPAAGNLYSISLSLSFSLSLSLCSSVVCEINHFPPRSPPQNIRRNILFSHLSKHRHTKHHIYS